MTRRLLASLVLTATVAGGLAALAQPAQAWEEIEVCIGGDNQRKPGYNQGICLIKTGNLEIGF